MQFCETKNKDIKCFKTVNKSGGFCVPFSKPNIGEIIRISSNADVSWHKILKTEIRGTSLEGQRLTKAKLIVMGEIQYDIKYLADGTCQNLNTVQITVPFSSYLSLADNANLRSMINVSVEIEDVYIDKFDGRYGYTNMTMLIIVDID